MLKLIGRIQRLHTYCYYIYYSLNVQIPASYNGQITIRSFTGTVLATNQQNFCNPGSLPTTVCICGCIIQSTAAISTIYLQIMQNVAATIVINSGFLSCILYA